METDTNSVKAVILKFDEFEIKKQNAILKYQEIEQIIIKKKLIFRRRDENET